MNDEQQIIEPVPTMAGYKKIPTFKLWIANQFPYIETDFDAITNYELLQAVIKYLNTIIENENNVESNVTALYNAFVNLHDYVENFFDNLDVQDEINNKLDKMVEDGTIESILLNYSQVAKVFDTYNDMMLDASTYVNGMKLKTLGYHYINDDGGAEYVVTNVQNDNKYQISIGTNLWIEMIIKDSVNVKQFGAYGDGVNDDTTSIQNALNYSHNIYIPNGTYMVNAVTSLMPRSDTKIELSNNANLKAITNNEPRYVVLKVIDSDNIEVFGGTIEGDRLTHTGTSGEWGYGIHITGTSSNIYIHDITIKNTWGDGLGVSTTGDVNTERVKVFNARRNGYSIIVANSFISTDDYIEGTNGTAPESGVDIEPDLGTEILNNIVFNNLHTKNNANCGVQYYLAKDNTGLFDNITFNNFISENDYNGLWIDSFANHYGKTILNNIQIISSLNRAIFLKNRGTNFRVELIKPYIKDYGVNATNPLAISSEGIVGGICGNILIENPYIISSLENTNARAIELANISNVTYSNIKIIDPIYLNNKSIGIRATSQNCELTDKYNILKQNVDADTVIGSSNLILTSFTTNYSSLRQIRIGGVDSPYPLGLRLKFYNTGDYGLKIYFQNQYILGISNDINKAVTTTEKGAYLEIERIAEATWCVVSKSGTFTAN